MKFKKIFLLMSLATFMGCTDLKETLNEDLTFDEAKGLFNVDALLSGSYTGLQTFQHEAEIWAGMEQTSDEMLAPTRGGDWDDNGKWRSLHNHTWGPEHPILADAFTRLLQIVFSTTNLLNFDPTPQQAAEARLIRAFAMYTVADGWNQVPFRQPGENLINPPKVLKGAEALDFVISECKAISADLPDGPATKANKNAAKVLLMKAYLNKGTFANRAAPTYPNGDMQEVIALADALIASNQYRLADNYFDNFAPKNDILSTENIWTSQNVGGVSGGRVRSRWHCTLHYNQVPSGWNGFATLSDFYDTFEDVDARKGGSYAGLTDVTGVRAGFLFGQQFDQTGAALKDRKGSPLSFTRNVALTEPDPATLELTGIRAIKYIPDLVNTGDFADNDYVLFRYADVLLMRAEALLRNGNAGGALTAVNEVRAKRGATALASLSDDEMLRERGREFYWEGQRRTDLIRFGKFLNAWQEKPASGPERLLFPIPATALAVNPNLSQNNGYK
ncbi:MAG: RagB/SusD family nutrient uptake outer membrane protein [Saprospiraceae bacterium]